MKYTYDDYEFIAALTEERLAEIYALYVGTDAPSVTPGIVKLVIDVVDEEYGESAAPAAKALAGDVAETAVVPKQVYEPQVIETEKRPAHIESKPSEPPVAEEVRQLAEELKPSNGTSPWAARLRPFCDEKVPSRAIELLDTGNITWRKTPSSVRRGIVNGYIRWLASDDGSRPTIEQFDDMKPDWMIQAISSTVAFDCTWLELVEAAMRQEESF